jgi:hypothetical protein
MFKLQPCVPDDKWNRLVDSSPQGTIFAHAEILSEIEHPVCWKVFKGDNVIALVCAVETPDGKNLVDHDLIVYSGVMFLPGLSPLEQFDITAFVVDELTNAYQSIFLAFAPQFVDIRPFLWHNYGQPGLHFVPDVRFTSTLQLPISIKEVAESRRKIVKNRQNIVTKESDDIDNFVALHQATFARKGLSVPMVAPMVRNLIKGKKGKLYLTSQKDQLAVAAVFGWDAKRAYYLWLGNAPETGDCGTLALWDALVDLRWLGIKEVDLEGINGPGHGHFKTSFGGTIVPYYHLRTLTN